RSKGSQTQLSGPHGLSCRIVSRQYMTPPKSDCVYSSATRSSSTRDFKPMHSLSLGRSGFVHRWACGDRLPTPTHRPFPPRPSALTEGARPLQAAETVALIAGRVVSIAAKASRFLTDQDGTTTSGQ